MKKFYPWGKLSELPACPAKSQFEAIINSHIFRANIQIQPPDRYQMANFFKTQEIKGINAQELLLAATATIGIFKVRRKRPPADIFHEPTQGTIPELIKTLVAINTTMFTQLDGKVFPITQAIAQIAHKMGAWVELSEPTRNPFWSPVQYLPPRWIVCYRLWNHCHKEDVPQNLNENQTAIGGLTKSLTDVLVAFAFDDLSIPMELGEALTIGYSLSLLTEQPSQFSQIWESRAELPPISTEADIFRQIFFPLEESSSSDERYKTK